MIIARRVSICFSAFFSTVTYPTEKHAAKVSGINPVIDDNGMIHIEATLEPHPHLLPGMTAFVTIEFR
jgi:hypothetical protein